MLQAIIYLMNVLILLYITLPPPTWPRCSVDETSGPGPAP
jgi:hypothetical protein